MTDHPTTPDRAPRLRPVWRVLLFVGIAAGVLMFVWLVKACAPTAGPV